VAVEANLCCRLSQLSIVVSTVNVMTGKTIDATPVHHALREVISLHAVLVGGAVGEKVEVGLGAALLDCLICVELEPSSLV
jgi:hypothetical protein